MDDQNRDEISHFGNLRAKYEQNLTKFEERKPSAISFGATRPATAQLRTSSVTRNESPFEIGEGAHRPGTSI